MARGNSRGNLGQSETSGECSGNRMQRSNIASSPYMALLESRICYPNMRNFAIFVPILVGFVISRVDSRRIDMRVSSCFWFGAGTSITWYMFYRQNGPCTLNQGGTG